MDEHTTLICLFHDPDQANAAVQDLIRAGIAKDFIGVMGNSDTAAADSATMDKWKVPERDARLLTDGIKNGGVVVAVSTIATMADKVETIFGSHEAGQIDETVVTPRQPLQAVAPSAPATFSSDETINVIEEQLTVGKRTVERGGVRVYSRITETPVSEEITLRDETIRVERRPVNRPVTAADTSAFKDQVFEMTETDEEAVVSKTAKVVEEVLIGKEASQHTETVKGTVRKTDVVVEDIQPETPSSRPVKR